MARVYRRGTEDDTLTTDSIAGKRLEDAASPDDAAIVAATFRGHLLHSGSDGGVYGVERLDGPGKRR